MSAVLAVSMLIPLVQLMSYAAAEMQEVSPYIIEFSCSKAADSFVSGEESAAVLSGEPELVTVQLSKGSANSLENSQNVLSVEEDIIMSANEDGSEEPTDDIMSWSTQAMGAPATHSAGETGEGVKIAVLDSGLDVYTEIEAYGGIDLVDPEYCQGDDMTGHGTAVSGIIAAPDDGAGVVGIAPEARIYVVRVLDESNEAPVSRIISGLDWCIENDVDIINMSFGAAEYSQLLETKITEASQAGILLVASAGNGEAVEYPAKFDEVIAVGSVTSSMTKAENSATGQELEFSAPGENVYTTSLIGGYGAFSGTSIASPHITGAAAVLWGKDKTKSPEFIRALLAASAKNLGDAESYGNGLPDLGFALQIYDGFAANYTDGTYTPPQNSGNAVTFEDEDVYVTGCWSANGHNGLADYLYNETNYNIRFPLTVKAVSKSVDRSDYICALIHGSGNYIVTAKLLFEIAVSYKTGVEGFSYGSYLNEKESSLKSLINAPFKSDQFALLRSDIELSLAEYSYANTSMNAYYSLGAKDFVSISEKTSTIIYGIFFHLIGDVYAHRSIVPTTSIASENATVHGSSTDNPGGNDGMYFVVGDFKTDCGKHVVSITEVIDEYYYDTLTAKIESLGSAEGYKILIALFDLLVWIFTGKQQSREKGAEEMQRRQNTADTELLKDAVDLTHPDESMCFCFGSMKRIAGLGVLQFKDIKLFLPNNSNYAANQAYYEDQAPNNSFYIQRYTAAKSVLKQYFNDFYSSVKGGITKEFLPYYLLTEGYGESINKYCIKLDSYYNYLKEYDPDSKLLKQSTWVGKSHSLFHYTTIKYNGNYFIDPSTYTNEYGKPLYGSTFPTNTNLTANDFYYGGKAW